MNILRAPVREQVFRELLASSSRTFWESPNPEFYTSAAYELATPQNRPERHTPTP
jgi:hypothetical protein